MNSESGNKPPGQNPVPEENTSVASGRDRVWTIGTFGFLAVAAWVLYQARIVVFILIGAVLMAAFLEPAVKWLSHGQIRGRTIHRKLAAAIVMVVTALVIAGLVVIVAPSIWQQGKEFVSALPSFYESARARLESLESDSDFLPEEVESAFEEEAARLMAQGGKLAAGWAFSQARQIFQLVTLLVIPIGAFYILTDGPNLRRWLLLALPPPLRPKLKILFEEGAVSLSRYVRGQTAVCIVAGIVHSIGFAIAGLPFALILGIIAGLAEAVPFLGSLVVILTVLIVGLAHDPKTALFGVGYYMIIGNQVANYIITPRLMSKNLDIHPFAVILAALIGASLGGPVGALIALPTTVVLLTLARRFWGEAGDAGTVDDTTPSSQ